MATHDYLIEDQTGANFRADINTVLSAIVSNNSSALEPTTTFAFMWWMDTTTSILKLRDASNAGWVNVINLSTGASVSVAINDLTDAISDGLNNLALGLSALIVNTTGSDNLAVGIAALLNNETGGGNTAVGIGALEDNTTGFNNTALGGGTLQNHTTGANNTCLGGTSGVTLTTGVNNTLIGASCKVSIPSANQQIGVGVGLVCVGNNNITIGTGPGADRVYNQFTANATWTRVSDERVKKDIETNEDCGLGFINDLRTVTYKFKAPNELDTNLSEYDKDNDKPSYDKRMYGFIAQEVKQALDKHGVKNFAGHHQIDDDKDNLQGISYEMFVMPLVKAVQELSTKNQELSDEIKEKNLTINSIMERIEDLEN